MTSYKTRYPIVRDVRKTNRLLFIVAYMRCMGVDSLTGAVDGEHITVHIVAGKLVGPVELTRTAIEKVFVEAVGKRVIKKLGEAVLLRLIKYVNSHSERDVYALKELDILF